MLIYIENLTPGFASVLGLKESPLLAGSPKMSQGSHIYNIGILGMNNNPGDSLGVLQPHGLPLIPSIDRLIDSGSDGNGISGPCFSRTYPDRIRPLLIDGYGPNGEGMLVKDRLNDYTSIGAFPQPPTGSPNIYMKGIALKGIHTGDPPTHQGWPNLPGLNPAESAGAYFYLGLGQTL
jgi:hypothetical protein